MAESDLALQVQKAIELINAGQITEAREILKVVVAADPNHETAWLWLATATTNRTERIAHLARVLEINPHNATARQAYEQLAGPSGIEDPPSPPPSDNKMSDRMRYFYLLSAVGALLVITIVVAISLRNESKPETDEPTVTIRSILPTATLTATSPYSPTPSLTPWPSATQGPSPTPPTLPPTWTPSPSATVRLTATPRPTWTPRPSSTPLPTFELASATPTAEPANERPTSPPEDTTVPDSTTSPGEITATFSPTPNTTSTSSPGP